MTKNDIQILSEIYDRTREERPREDPVIPQYYLDQVSGLVDALLIAFVEKPMMEKHVVGHYGSGYEEDFNKLKESITEFANTWEKILYEIDPGPDNN